jgi:hypothetical protein
VVSKQQDAAINCSNQSEDMINALLPRAPKRTYRNKTANTGSIKPVRATGEKPAGSRLCIMPAHGPSIKNRFEIIPQIAMQTQTP